MIIGVRPFGLAFLDAQHTVEPSPAPSDPTDAEDVRDCYGAGCGLEGDAVIVLGHRDVL